MGLCLGRLQPIRLRNQKAIIKVAIIQKVGFMACSIIKSGSQYCSMLEVLSRQ